MNKERAREELRDRKILAEIEYNQSEDAKKKDNLLRYIQALDIAIDSLEQDRETKEKMWAKQLNECEECEVINNEWVDVKNELPNEKEEVLVFTDHKCMYLGSYQKTRYGKIKWFGFKDICEEIELFDEKVVAWKKVEPYERKE